MSRSLALLTAVAFGLLLAAAARAQTEEPASSIRYTTRFVHPGPAGQNDLTIENYIIAQINATPPGAQIAFAVRDWIRPQVATAVTNAHNRDVDVIGVIDGGERSRPFLQTMVAALGGRVIFCGTPTFEFFSCLSDVLTPGLMHNKFWTFSELADGSRNVVIQTSQNFTGPQMHQFQDLVRIDGDVRLYDGYRAFVEDMKAQERTNDYFTDHVTSGDDGRNTLYPFPRFQPDPRTNDTIVDRLEEVDCSEGGSPDGTGLVRVAQFGFRSERMVIVDELAELVGKGCLVEVINTNGDPEVVAELVNQGVTYIPLFHGSTDVGTHTKLWFADAKNTDSDARKKIVYAGSANWRQDQHQTDDALLRVVDDGVYADYEAYWHEMRERAGYTRGRPPVEQVDAVAPFTAFEASPAPNEHGWNRSDVTIRITGSDGVGDQEASAATGMKLLRVELAGAQNGTSELAGVPYTVSLTDTPVVSQEGHTTVSFSSVDHKDNQSAVGTYEVHLDKTAPTLEGMPADCVLWPPNRRLVRVASISAADALSGLAALNVTASSNEADPDGTDTVVSGGDVWVRAERDGNGRGRIYTIDATATDLAGNEVTETAECFVPHDMGRKLFLNVRSPALRAAH
jgi:hypothetical protein